MASELLERLIIRRLDEISADYSVPRDNSVVVELPTEEAGVIKVVIEHHEKVMVMGADLISLGAFGIAKFPESRTRRAWDICNALNLRPPGKFILDSQGNVNYLLDWVVFDGAQPEDCVAMLDLVSVMIDARYSAIMTARWSDIPVEDALEVWREEEAEGRGLRLLKGPGMEDDEGDS